MAEAISPPPLLANCLKWGAIALAVVFVAYVVVQVVQGKISW